MIQPIVHDPLFLAQKSARATPADAAVARDLLGRYIVLYYGSFAALLPAVWAWLPT